MGNSSLTDTVARLRNSDVVTKTASRNGAALRGLSAAVLAAPLRPVTAEDFHAVKQADWSLLEEERKSHVEKLASSTSPMRAAAAAVRLAGIDDLCERREKVAAATTILRTLTLLQRGST